MFPTYRKWLKALVCLVIVGTSLGVPAAPRIAASVPTVEFAARPFPPAVPVPPVVRNQPGDLWADSVLGKPDFATVALNTTTNIRLFWSGGAIIDRIHNKWYIYDSGNNRVVMV